MKAVTRRQSLLLGAGLSLGLARPVRAGTEIDPGHGATTEIQGMRQFETIRTRAQNGVLFAAFDNPPLNLIGPALVRDLIDLLDELDRSDEIRIVVFSSAVPYYFMAHVDISKIADYTKETLRIGGAVAGSLGGLFRRVSETRQVTIAQVEGRARGGGSEFALACDMRFAARGKAIFGQIEAGFGSAPGAGGIQHLTRLLGRGRAMEAMLSSEDFDAELAERYGWINRSMPASELEPFVTSLALRIASFPAAGPYGIKRRINDIALSQLADVRTDAILFQQTIREPRAQARTKELLEGGMQTDGALERNFGEALGRLKG
ncbi:enoyl-CoA hydratase/carnithine racemase [Tardiphaga robiniae]|uniref:enoyl-CoA hydratase/isomerase family protein n=1 Tax=Tardiphaga robiniae TaxID=943830 RepID=UPI00285E9388|nr:enoyl-CoA hydratase/isomerase family protein [Tardiphaga robiniae]MDR6660862.1 enoyl-CoA hydratase/carnithine racemase [Tardiphaga robiniae]